MLGRTRLFIVCSGLGHVQRGYETFARECFAALEPLPELDVYLINASGRPRGHELRARALRREGRAARVLGRVSARDPYRIEALTYSLALMPKIARRRPAVVLYQDWPVGWWLARLRRAARLRFKLLLSSGAPWPPPYPPADHIQQLTPNMLRVALEAGVPAERQSVVPLGLAMSTDWTPPSPDERARLRERLGLPAERRVVLSVAALNDSQKRLGYLVDELAAMPEPRPFLAMLGQPDAETPSILARARDRLGEGNWLARTAAAAEMRDWYRAADVFVLASTSEAFGRVCLEAMAEGLPCVAHDYPTTQFLLGPHGITGDLLQPGGLSRLLESVGDDELAEEKRRARRKFVYDGFSWDVLRPRYLEMIRACSSA